VDWILAVLGEAPPPPYDDTMWAGLEQALRGFMGGRGPSLPLLGQSWSALSGWEQYAVDNPDAIVVEPPPPTPDIVPGVGGGGGGSIDWHRGGKRKRHPDDDLYEAVLETVRELVHGPLPVKPHVSPERRRIEPVHVEAVLDELLARAPEGTDLSVKVAALRRELAAYEAQRARDDDDDILLLM
jgi:hypothetical protein